MLGSMGREIIDGAPALIAHASELAALEDLWRRTGNEVLPRRQQLDARTLWPWLPHIALFDVSGSPPRFRIRLMGTACVRYAGGEFTGRWVDECVHESDGADIIAILGECLRTRAPVHSHSCYRVSETRRLVVQRLHLPCAEDGRTPDFIVGCAYASEVSTAHFPTSDEEGSVQPFAEEVGLKIAKLLSIVR